jgi:hypothetical protein
MRTLPILFLTLCALLTGCKTYNPVTVVVSDKQGNPISGASVQAAPMYFYNPTSNNYIIIGPYDILEPFPAKGSAGTTGEDGSVLLEIVTESPLELNVFAENHIPWKGQIAITKHGDVEINTYSNESLMRVTSR